MNLKAFLFYVLSSVQLLLQISATIVGMGYLLFSHSVMSDSLRPHGLQEPGFLVLHHLLELAHTHIDLVSDPIQPSRPLSSPSSPAFNLSQHLSQVFSSDSALHIRWPKYWSFKFSISPFNKYSELIYFRIDWFDLQSYLHFFFGLGLISIHTIPEILIIFPNCMSLTCLCIF